MRSSVGLLWWRSPNAGAPDAGIQEEEMAVRMTRSIGMLLLGVYLVLVGLGGLVAFALPSPVMAVLALIAGVLILIGR